MGRHILCVAGEMVPSHDRAFGILKETTREVGGVTNEFDNSETSPCCDTIGDLEGESGGFDCVPPPPPPTPAVPVIFCLLVVV